MLGLSGASERAPRTRNGQPAQSTTGAARKSSTQRRTPTGRRSASGRPGIMSLIARTKSGADRAADTTRRRRMSTSSALSSSSSADTSAGSSAIPQMGQAPGPTCRTSGCIGQV